jgi:membrane protein implicated in regulation of membrane protease activity
MPWWGWVVVGAVLLATELFGIPTDFFLFFLGVAALIVGLVGFLGIDLPLWGQWASFAVIAGVSLVCFRNLLRARFPSETTRADDTFVGEIAVASESLPAGASGRIELRGATWSARNAGDVALAKGDRARVERVEGLTLHVRRES